jgi:hypothetical protein
LHKHTPLRTVTVALRFVAQFLAKPPRTPPTKKKRRGKKNENETKERRVETLSVTHGTLEREKSAGERESRMKKGTG